MSADEGQQPPPQPPREEVTFLLTPGTAGQHEKVLDLSDASVVKAHSRAIAPLAGDEKYDVSATDLRDLLNQVDDRAKSHGWDKNILSIANGKKDSKGKEVKKYFIHHYGEFTVEQVIEHERKYLGEKNRSAQNSLMLYKCLMASLTKEGRSKILTDKEIYEVKVDMRWYQAGVTLLKVIMSKCLLENAAATRAIRTTLLKLPSYIVEIDYVITTFNEHVKKNVKDLAARGEVTSDIEYYVMEAYKKVPVRSFQILIETIEGVNDKRVDDEAIDLQSILDRAEAKYKTLLAEDKWKTKDEEIDALALETKITKKLIKRLEEKKRSFREKRKRQERNEWKNPKKEKRRRTKVDHTRKPKDITKPVTIDGKEWWWCCEETGGKCGGVLRRHKPNECKGIAGVPNPNQKKGDNKKDNDKKGELNLKDAYAKSTVAEVTSEMDALDLDLDKIGESFSFSDEE